MEVTKILNLFIIFIYSIVGLLTSRQMKAALAEYLKDPHCK